MFEKFKANIMFHQLLKRPNIDKAYAMVGPEDSWYDTISTVHNSLAQLRQLPREQLQLRSFDGLELHASPVSFDRVKNIAQAKYPLLLSAGSNERMENILNEIKERCPMETMVLILPGYSHGNGMYKQTEMYQTAIREFLQENISF